MGGAGGGGGGRVGHVRRHFRILLVDSQFLGEGFSSPYSSSGMKMSLKKMGRNGFLPIHRLTEFKYCQAVFGPNAPSRPFLPEGINNNVIVTLENRFLKISFVFW